MGHREDMEEQPFECSQMGVLWLEGTARSLMHLEERETNWGGGGKMERERLRDRDWERKLKRNTWVKTCRTLWAMAWDFGFWVWWEITGAFKTWVRLSVGVSFLSFGCLYRRQLFVILVNLGIIYFKNSNVIGEPNFLKYMNFDSLNYHVNPLITIEELYELTYSMSSKILLMVKETLYCQDSQLRLHIWVTGRFSKIPLQNLNPRGSASFCFGWGPGVSIFLKSAPHACKPQPSLKTLTIDFTYASSKLKNKRC